MSNFRLFIESIQRKQHEKIYKIVFIILNRFNISNKEEFLRLLKETYENTN